MAQVVLDYWIISYSKIHVGLFQLRLEQISMTGIARTEGEGSAQRFRPCLMMVWFPGLGAAGAAGAAGAEPWLRGCSPAGSGHSPCPQHAQPAGPGAPGALAQPGGLTGHVPHLAPDLHQPLCASLHLQQGPELKDHCRITS